MTARRQNLSELPYWPLYLSREEAARYVGVSPNLFDAEVKAGRWPGAQNRGLSGGRLTWYRPALDAAASAQNGGDDEERRFARYRAGAKGQDSQKGIS